MVGLHVASKSVYSYFIKLVFYMFIILQNNLIYVKDMQGLVVSLMF